MTEIPEHLRKRAEAARQKAATTPADDAPAASDAGDGGAAETPSDSRIPAHLLERAKAARGKASRLAAVP